MPLSRERDCRADLEACFGEPERTIIGPSFLEISMKKFLLPVFIAFLLVSCGKSHDITVDSGKPLEVQSFNAVMGTKNLVDPVHGKETRFAYGAVSGVNGTKANGVAFLHTFADGTSVLTVNVNILPAPAGHTFVAWATDDAGSSYVSAGELRSVLSDARHAAVLETKQDVSHLAKVVVTLESSVRPDRAGVHQAEGTLKVVKK